MLKVSFFRGLTEQGPTVVPLFNRTTDAVLEKVAGASLLPDVVRYIDSLRPSKDAVYNLVNAMGAGEYFGSNINGDYFPEAALIHRPDKWTGNPLVDKIKSKDWPYGFPTFYSAHPFAHHRNKDASRAFGEVELAVWHDGMKRVELVTRVDKEKCLKYGGAQVWDKLVAGMFPDVSMGCLRADGRITMADGSFKYIKDVQEADLVLTHTGQIRRVTTTMRRPYQGTLYSFHAYGFRRPLQLTGEHPVWVVRSGQLTCTPTPAQVNKGRKQRHCTPFVKAQSKGCTGCSTQPVYTFEWVPAEDVDVGDYVAFPVPGQVDTFVSSKEEAKLLGYYLAEGFIRNYNDREESQITFCLNLQEKELAEEIESLARALGAKVVWHDEHPDKGGRYVHVVSSDLARRCSWLCGSGAKEKQVSREVLYMDPELQRVFLGAYLDGDGGTYKGSAYFSTASEQLADQIFIMLSRVGIIASVNEIQHRPSEKSVVRKDTVEYQVWVGTDFAEILAPYTRKSVRSSLKVRGQRFFYESGDVTYVMAPILEIAEEDFKDDVFNFSVDGDESYVAERLAVHNCKVPFDTCSVCLDWKLYREAQGTFNPKKHKHPGEAVLHFHRTEQQIRGLSITRKDYCEHALKQMNHILPNGKKVFVHNDYPRFFDISFVFIGADKTAKTMMKIASPTIYSLPTLSVDAAEKLGYVEELSQEKVAAAFDDLVFEAAFGKDAKAKKSEIIKDVIPSQFAGKAIPALTAGEKDLPSDVLDTMAKAPLEGALATSGGLGVVLRPREFQRLVLINMGKKDVADELDVMGEVFPRTEERAPLSLGSSDFMPALVRLLLPLLMDRSALSPMIERRVIIVSGSPQKEKRGCSSLSSDLLRKIGAAYNSYRDQLMELVAHAQDLIEGGSSSSQVEFRKLSGANPEEVFSPLSVAYLQTAFLDERADESVKQARADVERGLPSRNT